MSLFMKMGCPIPILSIVKSQILGCPKLESKKQPYGQICLLVSNPYISVLEHFQWNTKALSFTDLQVSRYVCWWDPMSLFETFLFHV